MKGNHHVHIEYMHKTGIDITIPDNECRIYEHQQYQYI